MVETESLKYRVEQTRRYVESGDRDYDWSYVHELLDYIDELEAELAELRKPEETVKLSMARVDKLMVAAGWIPRGNGFSYGRGTEAVTISYVNGIFGGAWKNSQRIEDFNDLIKIN